MKSTTEALDFTIARLKAITMRDNAWEEAQDALPTLMLLRQIFAAQNAEAPTP